MVIRDAIFDPDVARLYRQRLEKYIRRWGNHPSICLWFMHFNLANYLWYVAPSKMAGYKPSDPAFLAKERFALEAQRIANRSIRGRSIITPAATWATSSARIVTWDPISPCRNARNGRRGGPKSAPSPWSSAKPA